MNLQINKLNKIYANGVKALHELSLEIGSGMFGLLGPNGAGKSTLMRTIATLQLPDSGSLHFKDIDILNNQMALRKILGYLPQEFGVYPKVSALNLLDYFATLKGVASKKERSKLIDRVLEITNLYEVRKKHVSSYSGGMKQRFGIAQLLLNNPQLIIVDEPTAGLDPAERNRFLNILREIGTENTVIFSTHIVEDVKELCTDMAIINKGEVLLHKAPLEACKAIEGKVWTKDISRTELELAEEQYTLLSSSYNEDHSIAIRIYAAQAPDTAFRAVKPVLEDVYFITLREKQ